MLSKYRVYRYDQMESPVITAGRHAVLIGAQNGLFPDMGFNVEGEMGGLWAGEKKVCSSKGSIALYSLKMKSNRIGLWAWSRAPRPT